MKRKANKAVLGVLFLVVFFMAIFIFFSVSTLKSLKSSKESSRGDEPIAVVEVKGVILDSRKLVKLLRKAELDNSVEAIIIRVDSPGGAVGPTQEVYEEIQRIDKDVKPVFASFGSIAASGGYYLGAATRKIYSNPGTITGSIGVIMQFVNMQKLYEFAKIRPETIKAGKYKDIGSPSRAITQAERSLLDNMIEGVHDQFINDILRTRKDKIKGKIREHAQGQIFSGEQAYNLGLVDEFMGLYKAARKIHEDLEIEGEFGLRFIKEEKGFKLQEFLEGVESSLSFIKSAGYVKELPVLMFSVGN